MYPAHAVFGGYKESGFGRETHKIILDHYQQTKNLLVSYSHRGTLPCRRTAQYQLGFLQRRLRMPSDFLVFDLQFRLRCRRGFRITIFVERAAIIGSSGWSGWLWWGSETLATVNLDLTEEPSATS